ncbi:hypothetical protein C3B54_111301 [Pontimonas salivibrio]|uniref:Uncharacterized protein n=1 Tax=Pontimonas salivibrio TaxID=1159327 RepID=A0A2L2BRG1_9MICO|nr:hypothetical protein C3B54_111301 [Pontimonas salivibrio]
MGSEALHALGRGMNSSSKGLLPRMATIHGRDEVPNKAVACPHRVGVVNVLVTSDM